MRALSHAAQTIDMQDFNAVNLLDGAHAFADDFGQVAQQCHTDLHFDLFRAQYVGGFVHCARAFGIHAVLLFLRLCQQDFRIRLALCVHTALRGFGFCGNTQGFGAVDGGLFFGFCGHGQCNRFFLRGFLCGNQFHCFGTFGALGFAHGNHAFFFAHGGGTRFVGFGLGFGFCAGFFRHGNRTVLFRQFDCFAAFHFGLLHGLRFADVFVFNVAFGGNAFQIHFAFGGNFCFFGFTFFGGFLLGNAGFLFGAAQGDFALLVQLRIFFFAQDLQAAAFGFQIFAADGQIGVLLDVVAFFAAYFNGFSQTGQAFRVEGVLRVEEFKCRLVQAGQRHGFQLQAVFIQIFRYDLLHFLHEIHPFFMQLFHGHFGGDGTQAVHKFAFHQFFQLRGRHGFHTQRLRGGGNAFGSGFHAHIKFGGHVHAHAVARNQGLVGFAAHFQSQRVHVYGDDFMQHGQHQRTAVHNHFFTAPAGAHERYFFAGTAVQAR